MSSSRHPSRWHYNSEEEGLRVRVLGVRGLGVKGLEIRLRD